VTFHFTPGFSFLLLHFFTSRGGLTPPTNHPTAAGSKETPETSVPSDLQAASKKELQDSIVGLQKSLKERDEYILSLRQYIDKVLLRVIEKSPDILEDL